jgi:D-3-phosphoglycerate dehydrogenase
VLSQSEDDVNEVNAPALAAERGIEVSETKRTTAHDYTDLVRVGIVSGSERVRVAGTLIGRRNRPHLLEAWGQRFDMQLEHSLTVLRYRDLPGMVGHAGTVLGRHGINIISAAVGRRDDEQPGEERNAVMAITTDSAVPGPVIEEIVAGEGFAAGHTVTL